MNTNITAPKKNGDEHLKGAFLISQPLRGITLDILKDIIQSSKFQYVLIVTNVNPLSYDESSDYFDTIRDKCLTMWMANPVKKQELYKGHYFYTLILLSS